VRDNVWPVDNHQHQSRHLRPLLLSPTPGKLLALVHVVVTGFKLRLCGVKAVMAVDLPPLAVTRASRPLNNRAKHHPVVNPTLGALLLRVVGLLVLRAVAVGLKLVRWCVSSKVLPLPSLPPSALNPLLFLFKHVILPAVL